MAPAVHRGWHVLARRAATPPEHPDALALADFNNDGMLDVAVASDAPTESVVVLLGNGLGGLGAGVAHTWAQAHWP